MSFCVCVCVDYIWVLVCVVYGIDRMCVSVYGVTCPAWLICDYLMNICVAICRKRWRKSREGWGIILFFFYCESWWVYLREKTNIIIGLFRNTILLHYIYIYIYIYIFKYIVIHSQIRFVISEFISVAKQARFPKLGSKPGWLKRQSKILPLSHEETSDNLVNVKGF